MKEQRIHYFFEMKLHKHPSLYKPRKSLTLILLSSYIIGLHSQGQYPDFQFISQLGSCLLPLLQIPLSHPPCLLPALNIKVNKSSQTIFYRSRLEAKHTVRYLSSRRKH